MKQELLEKLEKNAENLIDFLEKSGEGSAEFVSEQTPLVMQEILNLGFYSSLMGVIFGVIGVLVCGYISYRIHLLTISQNCTDPYLLNVFLLIPLIPTSLCFTHSLNTLIQINLAPRLYLIQEISKFIR